MKTAIFAIAALAILSFGATANANYYEYECGYECQSPPSPPMSTPSVMETAPNTIDPWLLIKNRVLAKENPTQKVRQACAYAGPERDFHRDIGGIALDPHHWTSLACVRARFERIEAMMEK